MEASSSNLEEGGLLGDKFKAPSKKQKLKQDCFLGFCRTLNFVTGLGSLLCCVAFGLAIAVAPQGWARDAPALIHQALRMYGILFGLLILLVETEWERVLAGSRMLDSWTGRGAFQLFVALLTLQMAIAEGESDFHKSLQLYRVGAGVSLLCCSVIYIIGGVLCFGRIKRARTAREIERMRVQGDLEELEKKREQLQGMLAVYSTD